MLNVHIKEINFVGHRKVFFILSAALIVIAFLAMGIRGLEFGPEFVGGTTVTYLDVHDTNEDGVREAMSNAGYDGNAVVQTIQSGDLSGYLVQMNTTDIQQAESIAQSAATALGVSSENIQVSTIGANWGASVVQSSIIALAVALLLIIL